MKTGTLRSVLVCAAAAGLSSACAGGAAAPPAASAAMVEAVDLASGHTCSSEIARGLEGVGLAPSDVGRVEVVARYSSSRERERFIGYLAYVGRADNAGVYLVNLRRNCALMNVSGG